MNGSRHAWILDGPRDLLLLVGTPLLVVPALVLARATWSDMAIAGAVLAFGATGHHLPGLLRAYGDRDLFERFRARFVFGPVLLFIACFFFYTFSFHGLIAMITLWGTWHALAQVYGFGRIYDAKVGAFDPRTAQLDKALCIVWFVLPLLMSPWRLTGLLEDAYVSGLPIVSAENMAAAQTGWWLATGLVTALWLANFVVRLLRGEPGNPIKAALFASSMAFWYYALTISSHAIVGLAMFEIFHDIQYLTIVWLYNRRRVDQPGAKVSRVLRFLFRPGVALLPLYVAGVFAYGGLDFLRQRLPTGELAPVLSGLFAMSAFLHYYYDSFIWNLRDASTRESLSVEGSIASLAQTASAWLPQIRNWAWFALPLCVLVGGQVAMPRDALEVRRAVVETLPRNASAWSSLANTARQAQNPTLERQAIDRMIALAPDAAEPHLILAAHLQRQGLRAEAQREIERAKAIDPAATRALLQPGDGNAHPLYQPAR